MHPNYGLDTIDDLNGVEDSVKKPCALKGKKIKEKKETSQMGSCLILETAYLNKSLER